MNDPQKVLRLKVLAKIALCAFEIRNDLSGKDLDNDMSIVYAKAALVELGHGESADIELVILLLTEATKVHVPKRAFAPGGVVLPVNTKQEFHFKTGTIKKSLSPDISRESDSSGV
jgi:hypothetical protein